MKMRECPLIWIIIGVSGSGKTAVGRLLSEQLECDFLEGDRRHSLSNITKMRSHLPLQDEDRRQWLVDIGEDIRRAIAYRRETVITCSALKVAYRRRLKQSSQVQLVWLEVPEEELRNRLSQRSDHYMKPELLHSQLAAFESVRSEENIITLDGRRSPPEIVRDLLSLATQLFPNMQKEWWQRCFL